MVIGGITTDDALTDNIELVSLDSNPVPDCLSNLRPFFQGRNVAWGAGAALESGNGMTHESSQLLTGLG